MLIIIYSITYNALSRHYSWCLAGAYLGFHASPGEGVAVTHIPRLLIIIQFTIQLQLGEGQSGGHQHVTQSFRAKICRPTSAEKRQRFHTTLI